MVERTKDKSLDRRIATAGMTFFDRLRERIRATGGMLAVGLNHELARLPDDCREYDYPRRAFTRRIVDATHEDAAVYVVNPAFYEDSEGWTALAETVAYAHGQGVPVVLDGKWSDVPSGRITGLLDRVDAVTVSPLLGRDALAPVLDRDLGAFVVCRTPNPGATDLQERELAGETGESPAEEDGESPTEEDEASLAERVADLADDWAADSEADVGLLVGGPSETVEALRERAPGLPFLVVGGATNDPEVAEYATPEDGDGTKGGGGGKGGDDTNKGQRAVGLVCVSREVIYAGETAGRGRESGQDAYATAARQSARRLKRQLSRHR